LTEEDLKRSGLGIVPAVAVKGWPDNTIMVGTAIMLNVGGPSPGWLLDLMETKAGERMARRILVRLVREA